MASDPPPSYDELVADDDSARVIQAAARGALHRAEEKSFPASYEEVDGQKLAENASVWTSSFVTRYTVSNAKHGLTFNEAQRRKKLDSRVTKKKKKKKKNGMAALFPQSVTVVRDGVEMQAEAADLVIGDIVKLRTGDKVPCDLKILESDSCSVDQSMMTGEAEPVHVREDAEDMHSIAYDQNLVLRGSLTGVAFAVGDLTQMGQIAELVAVPKSGGFSMTGALKVQKLTQEHNILAKTTAAVSVLGKCTAIVLNSSDLIEMGMKIIKFHDASASVVEFASYFSDCVLGLEYLQEDYTMPPVVALRPFNSRDKFAVKILQTDTGRMLVACGAAERVFGRCQEQNAAATEFFEDAATSGLRCLSVARKMLTDDVDLQDLPTSELDNLKALSDGWELVGVVGMARPPRPQSKAALQAAIGAGIRVVIVSSDHPLSVTRAVQECAPSNCSMAPVMTGNDLDLSHLNTATEEIVVFARMSPQQRLEVVGALQEASHVVCVIGADVADSPALKKADVGVAMGISGTCVAKEAGDLIVLDDSIHSVVSGMLEMKNAKACSVM